MALQEKEGKGLREAANERRFGLYVHVPFCATSCDFCAFHQDRPSVEALHAYLDGVEAELALRPCSQSPETIFWGGGTPGLLPAPAIEKLGALCLAWAGEAPAEWTVELSPSMVNPSRLKALKSLGVNRLSLGIQSWDAATLAGLGRDHSPEQAERAIDMIRELGFANLNLDLMFALPGQSLAAWHEDLARTFRFEPEHISTYCLTFEEDTALWLKLREGSLEKPNEEREARFYTEGWSLLEAAGYAQYEISNFAREGYACRHNLATWQMQEWLGVGPSACSQLAGRRWRNLADTEGWLAGMRAAKPVEEEIVMLSHEDLFLDALIFGLRMNAGVDVAALEARFGMSLPAGSARVLEQLAEEGLLLDGSRLSERGRLLVDAIGADLLEAAS